MVQKSNEIRRTQGNGIHSQQTPPLRVATVPRSAHHETVSSIHIHFPDSIDCLVSCVGRVGRRSRAGGRLELAAIDAAALTGPPVLTRLSKSLFSAHSY